jgi:class 3 adenylate cyclase
MITNRKRRDRLGSFLIFTLLSLLLLTIPRFASAMSNGYEVANSSLAISQETPAVETDSVNTAHLYSDTFAFFEDLNPMAETHSEAANLLLLLLVVLSIYNLIRFMVVQDASLILLAVALIGIGLFWASAFGLMGPLFGIESSRYGAALIFYTSTIASVGLVSYSMSYLSTRYLSPGSYNLLSVMMLIFVVQAVMGIVGFWTLAIWTQLILSAVAIVLLLTVAIISLTKGFPPAIYYLGAHVCVLMMLGLGWFSGFSIGDVQLSGQTLIIAVAAIQPILLTLGNEFRLTYLKSQKEQAKALAIASHRLARYFPKQLVNKVLSDREMISLNSKRQMVTVLFSDLSGFTSLTDQLEPERITDLLNQFMTHMVYIINRHDGTLDKFIGDGIMALFGAPDEMEPEFQARQAVKAAVLMHQKFKDLAQRWRDEGIDHDIKLRIGIHQDFVTVGNVGSNEYMSYTAIGRGVNLASRLERACTPGKVHVSYEVYSHTHEEYPFEDLQKKLFKGFKRPHRISELDPWEYFQDDIESRNKKSKISQRFY